MTVSLIAQWSNPCWNDSFPFIFFSDHVHIPSASQCLHSHISKTQYPGLLEPICLVHVLSDSLEETITFSSPKRCICFVFSFYEHYFISFLRGKFWFCWLNQISTKLYMWLIFTVRGKKQEKELYALLCIVRVCVCSFAHTFRGSEGSYSR